MKAMLDDVVSHYTMISRLPPGWLGRVRAVWRQDDSLSIRHDAGAGHYWIVLRPLAKGDRWLLFHTFDGRIRRFRKLREINDYFGRRVVRPRTRRQP